MISFIFFVVLIAFLNCVGFVASNVRVIINAEMGVCGSKRVPF